MRKVVCEYVQDVEGLRHPVKGRITFDPEADAGMRYMWEVSHHCKPSGSAGVYYPSNLHGDTEEEALQLLKMYLEPFTAIEVTKNESY